MKNLWDKTTQVTPELAKSLLESQLSLEVSDIQLMGEGFDNTAYLINQSLVFRFPHRIEALAPMENEILLLPYLASTLSFPISAPTFVGKPNERFPYPFAGYPLLKGQLLSHYQAPLVDNSGFAKILGAWLSELHSLPVQREHQAKLKGEHDWRLDVTNRTERVNGIVDQYAEIFKQLGFDPQKLKLKMQDFKDLNIAPFIPCYVHGDLYAKHIVVDESGFPKGLIDWGDIHISHPAIDISGAMMILTPNTFKIFLSHYSHPTEDLINIAAFRAFCHAITALAYFAQVGDDAMVAWTKAALSNKIVLYL